MDDTSSYKGILEVLSVVAQKYDVNEETLKKIYKKERGVVHLHDRYHINEELRRIMFGDEYDT